MAARREASGVRTAAEAEHFISAARQSRQPSPPLW